MRATRFLRLTLLLALLGVAQPCLGQQGRDRRSITGWKLHYRIFEQSLGYLWHPLTVVQIPAVQDDLQLDTERRQQLNELLTEASNTLVLDDAEQRTTEGGRLRREEILKKQGTKVPALIKDFEPKLYSLLTEVQRRRLDQIVLQAQGGEALTRADIADALNLTAEQRDQVQSIKAKHAAAVAETAKMRPVDIEQSRVKATAQILLERHRHPDLMAILTAGQSDQLRAMQGTPFDTSWFNVSDMYGTSQAPDRSAQGGSSDATPSFLVNYRLFETASGTKWQRMTVIQFPSVQRELSLTRDVATELNKILKEAGEFLNRGGVKEGTPPRPTSREESDSMMRLAVGNAVTDFEPRIKELLNEQQVSRLDQIVLQAQRGDALFRTEIAEKLGLSAGQKDQLRMISDDHLAVVKEEYKQPITGSQVRARISRLHQLAEKKQKDLLSLLDGQQTKALGELTGTPADISFATTSDNILGPRPR